MIEIRQVEPNVHVDVVLLYWPMCVVFLNSWTCYNEELILKASNWVTVTRSSQFVLFNSIKGDAFCVQDFGTSGQRNSVNSVEVTTANQENALWGCLTVLEVVREICVNFHLFSSDGVGLNVVFNNYFWVSLKNIHSRNPKSDCGNLRLSDFVGNGSNRLTKWLTKMLDRDLGCS